MTDFERWLAENGVEYESSRYIKGYREYGKDFIVAFSRALKQGREPVSYRREAIRLFSFAILDAATVRALLPYGPFLEVGAGTGYWAYELAKAGADVVATDPDPYSCNNMHSKVKVNHYPVDLLTGVEAVAKYITPSSGKPARALLAVWPSYDEPWAAETLLAYAQAGGRCVIYVGEGKGGCTADDAFHEILEDEEGPWNEENRLPLLTWWRIHDRVYIYTREGES